MLKVSVVITSYNRGHLLKRAVESVLEQSYKNFELIIVDDCSSDPDTLLLLEDLKVLDPRVFVHIMEANCGSNRCRNYGIEVATGYFYTGLDDDDYFRRDRLSTFIDNYDDELSFVCDDFVIIKKDNKRANFRKPTVLCSSDLEYRNLAGNQIFTAIEKIRDIGGFDVEFKRLQDQDTWLRLIKKYGDARRLNVGTYFMDISHEGERITNNVKSAEAFHTFYQKHKLQMTYTNIVKNRIRLYKYGVNERFYLVFLLQPILFFKAVLFKLGLYS